MGGGESEGGEAEGRVPERKWVGRVDGKKKN